MQENFQFDVRLDWLQMTYFRRFDQLAISFHPQLTVIIGKNGAGKTTVIEAVAGLLQVMINKISSQNSEYIQGFGKKDIRNGAIQAINEIKASINGEELEWNGTLTADGYEADITLYETKLEKVLDEKGDEVLDRNGDPIEKEVSQPAEADRQPFAKLEQLVRQVNFLLNDHKEVSLPLLQYYPCFAAQQDYPNGNGEKQTDSIFSIYENALSGRSFDFPAFFEWFRWQEQRALAGKSDSLRIIKAVRDAVYIFMNDGEAEFDNLTIDWDVKDGELVIFKSGERLALNQLSSGEKTLFLLVSDMARRLAKANPDKDNPLHGNGIVLIDEIDLHLHPGKQREVLPKLLQIFPNVQFVVTTHSPVVINNLDPEKASVYMLDETAIQLQHFAGRDIGELMYEFYGIKSRPKEVQQIIDEMFLLIEQEKMEEAKTKLTYLKARLGEEDSAVMDATNSIELLEEIL